ncbi:adenylate/guanylate cyclase domain-containing protein [Motiliproteus sp. MSK22-1]|uniref:adenylate/guanylate cyclase domain-containing protein n=1 Tax=Motiliproteus sp. MSK22-1 TaxID=1897630 RepID=UPI000975B51D|nr:adenylate/guanylate cyclase domain-containing protein [Motiliproteus sp. MSK22-1]OMH39184.1 hypothetical protein BGP75_05685 [Motiliproteus sp. MSK22-1]
MSDQSSEHLAVLFADIGDSTPLYEKVGDDQAYRLIIECLGSMEQVIQRNGGKLLRTVGDAVLASFNCCDDAFQSARDMQEAQISSQLSIRVGFHFGSVISDKGDLYGSAVNIASRVAALAATEEIMTTGPTVERLATVYRSRAIQLKPIRLKGIDEPITLYRLDWADELDSTTLFSIAAGANGILPARANEMFLSLGDQVFTVNETHPTCEIGRKLGVHLRVIHASTSRRHAFIKLLNGKFMLTDQSTNGTYIVKQGSPAVFVHRDAVVLDGAGDIGVGFLPDTDTNSCINFKLS